MHASRDAIRPKGRLHTARERADYMPILQEPPKLGKLASGSPYFGLDIKKHPHLRVLFYGGEKGIRTLVGV